MQFAFVVLQFLSSLGVAGAAAADVARSTSQPALADAISISMRRSGADKIVVIQDASRQPVDLEDILSIRIDRSKLGRSIVESNESLRQLDDVSAHVKSLEGVLDGIKNYSILAGRISTLRSEIILEGNTADAAYWKLVGECETSRGRIREAVANHLKLILPESENPRAKLSELIKGSPDYRKLASFVREEITRISSLYEEAVMDAAQNGVLRLRLRATLLKRQQKGAIPIHLDGYDDGRAGEYHFREKLSFVQTPERSEKIERSLEMAGKVKASLDASMARRESVYKVLRDAYEVILASSAAIPDVGAIEQKLRELEEVAKVFERDLQGVASLGQTRTSLKEIQDFARRLVVKPEIAKIASTIRSLPGAKSDADVLRGVREIVEVQVPNTVKQQIVELSTASYRLDELRKKLESAIDGDLEIVRASGSKVLATAEELFTLVEPFVAKVKGVVDWRAEERKDLQQLLNSAGLFQGLEGATWNAFAVPISSVRDTRIDMNAVPAEDGDRLLISAELLMENAVQNGALVVEDSANAAFHVRSLGWSANVSGDLLFALPERSRRFVSATGVSYVYSYKPWQSTTPGGAFGEVINPGFGLTFAVLNQSGDSLQTGVAPTFTLLRGLISVGGGYALQAGRNPWFGFIGFRFTNVNEVRKSTTGSK